MQAANVLRESRMLRGLGMVALLVIVAALLAIAAATWMNADVSQTAARSASRTSQTGGAHRYQEVLQAKQQGVSSQPTFADGRAENSRLTFSNALPGETRQQASAPHGIGLTESEPWTPPVHRPGIRRMYKVVECKSLDPRSACIQP